MRKKKVSSARKIRLVGSISEESFAEFCERLDQLESESTGIVEIDLCSGGGDSYSALAFCSRMRLSPCDFQVTVYGYAMSAAVLILAEGSIRRIAREAWTMVHEDISKAKGSVTDMQREADHFRALENQWAVLLEAVTGTSAATWTNLHKKTTYLSAKECLELGLVDEVI